MKNCGMFLLNVTTPFRISAFFIGPAVALFVLFSEVIACPFCSVESQTLSEETQSADAVVLAKLLKEAPPANDVDGGFGVGDPESGMAMFQVIDVLKGQDRLAGVKEIKVVFFGEPDREQVYLVSGIGAERIDWTTPLPLSAAGVEYARKLPEIPASGPERLAFFQEHLEHEDPLLAQDAYDEFARAPYADVKALGPRMHHDRLVKWINDPNVSPSRRRLYLTMLGVCGTAADLPTLESLIASDFQIMKPHLERLVSICAGMGGPLSLPVWVDLVDQDERRKKMGLDALIGAYLALRGPEGMDLIDERFLKNPGTEYTHTYSTIMALRILGEELAGAVPRERLLASMRLLLDNPEFADQVILDLARWEDWSVLDRLVKMFKESDENGYVRQPIVSYLTVASEQPSDVGAQATKALGELEELDPEGVKQARSLMAFGALGRARASTATAGASRPADEATVAADDAATENGDEATAAGAETENADQTAVSSEFPDPADYATGDEKQQPAVEEVSAKEQAPVSVQPAAAAAKQPTANVKPANQASDEARLPGVVDTEINRGLIVGVPLAAALGLMGIYWLILRTGAI